MPTLIETELPLTEVFIADIDWQTLPSASSNHRTPSAQFQVSIGRHLHNLKLASDDIQNLN